MRAGMSSLDGVLCNSYKTAGQCNADYGLLFSPWKLVRDIHIILHPAVHIVHNSPQSVPSVSLTMPPNNSIKIMENGEKITRRNEKKKHRKKILVCLYGLKSCSDVLTLIWFHLSFNFMVQENYFSEMRNLNFSAAVQWFCQWLLSGDIPPQPQVSRPGAVP